MAYLNYDKASGKSLVGVPARDLSREEFDRFSDDVKATILASGLYSMEGEPAHQEIDNSDRPPRKTTRRRRE